MAITLSSADLDPLIRAGIVSKTYGLADAGGFDLGSSLGSGSPFDPGGYAVSGDYGYSQPSPFDPGGYAVSGGYGTSPSPFDPGGYAVSGDYGTSPNPAAAGQHPLSGWQKFLSGVGDFAKGISPGLQAIGGIAAGQQAQAFQAQQEARREAFELQKQALEDRASLARVMAGRQAPPFHSEGGAAQPLRFGAGAPGTTIDPLASYANLIRSLR
jgi:hypothetical protein